MDSNPSQPPVSTTMDPGMHKEDQQATGGPTSLGVTSEARANPQLSSSMSAFNLNEPIYSASFIIHSESASGNDASAVSTAKVDPRNYAPSDFVPQQQGINEGTKNTSYDHLFAGAGPHVLAEQIKSVSEGLDTVLTQSLIGKGASSVARQVEEEEASRTIKLEDLAKLSDAEEDDGIHATKNVKTKETLVPKSSSPKSSLIQELTNQLNELLVKSLKTKFSNILSAYDFSSSLPTELKNLPSKFNKLTEEVKELKNQVHNLEIDLPGDLKEILTKLEDFTKTVTSLTSQVAELKTLQWELPQEFLSLPGQVASVQAKLKTLDALPGLLSHVTKALNKFAQEDKGKKALSSEEAEKESIESGFDDETTHMPGSMVESSKQKELKKFDFVTESGEHVHLTKEHISAQKKIEEEVKAKAARRKASVVEVPSASALQVLRRLGSIFTSMYAAVHKLKDSWLELQFSLADNSKLKRVFHF
ncbi:hypothetical protein Tco_0655220 [Tanacetum coccineum]|uniref:Uncharacterized protein n=1 Tax=Tanacetum coccineum TaxID=301880 RepID=A0ABQ4X6H3_9ASTR